MSVDHVEETVVVACTPPITAATRTRAPSVEEEEEEKGVVGEDRHPKELERPTDVGHDAIMNAGDPSCLCCSNCYVRQRVTGHEISPHLGSS